MTNPATPPRSTPQTSTRTTALFISALVAAPLLLGTGGLVDYLYGYKDSWLLEGTYVLLIVFGCMALFVAGIATLVANASSDTAAPAPAGGRGCLGRILNILKLLSFGAGFLACIALMVGSLVFIEQWRNERVGRLLATAPTVTTTATVTKLRTRSSRSGMVYATLLTYRAGTEQVNQAIPGRGFYAVGQQVRVKYVVEHPDIFKVAE